MNLYTADLTVGEVAERIGVAVPTLRAWERRYGYPVPERLPSGHRRYTSAQVQALEEVLRARSAGVGLEAALAGAAARAQVPRGSILSSVRRMMPDVPPVVLSERAMLAVSRAVEDEVASRAERPILIGAFQQDRFWRRSEHRWLDLAETALVAVAFGAAPRARPPRTLVSVPLDPGTPLAREWAIVCDDGAFTACLVGVERPGSRRQGVARFEALWTVEPAVVRAASRGAWDFASSTVPELPDGVTERLQVAPVATADTIRAATSLSNRIIRYLDGRLPPSPLARSGVAGRSRR